MDRVSYDNDFGDIIDGARLIDTTSDSKQFCFRTCYKGSVMNCFDKWSIEWVYVRNRCSDIILDAGVGDHEGSVRFRRALKNYFVKFLVTKFVITFFFFIN